MSALRTVFSARCTSDSSEISSVRISSTMSSSVMMPMAAALSVGGWPLATAWRDASGSLETKAMWHEPVWNSLSRLKRLKRGSTHTGAYSGTSAAGFFSAGTSVTSSLTMRYLAMVDAPAAVRSVHIELPELGV